MITPTQRERAEWSRIAQAAYNSGRLALGDRFNAAAALPAGARMTDAEFDALQCVYRAWLAHGEWPKAHIAA